MHKILLTGYSGFVGSSLFKVLQENCHLSLLGRKSPKSSVFNFHQSEFNNLFDFSKALTDVNVIIHCAARVHIMNDESSDPLNDFRSVNTEGTLNLARQAVTKGVKRFIFISSIKVNGESNKLHKPFKSTDERNPKDFYGQSKSEAEEQLLELAEETGLEVVIIRPTLVYGPGVKANFASLLNLVSKGLPLPFGCIINNKRSLVSVNNLVDLVITCIDHPKAANQVFLVSDDHDVSTSEMVREMAKSLNKPQWQLPIPKWCYKLAGSIFGKQDVVDRLLGSLQVDITHTKETLDWKPPQTLEEGFKETAEAFLLNKENKK
ncbi:SDR family oxidoreductase [Aliivibrio sp. S2TY2]|uniref:UDP-glucose 4-epimerase family protein n=1 Tax=unclassified Aliivibrio TaxID=2645654 RepID=UPI002379BE28|nr:MULTISPECIES: SDR family oxidoreductase [unclassified Aliivibrio]MDD9174886.1 SDR family oxidoreductase [Aliivibrio sp. S3TY1]MDD9192167.1 SDR family oxidoreductase [Aliivibrio sp. S2TY2]